MKKCLLMCIAVLVFNGIHAQINSKRSTAVESKLPVVVLISTDTIPGKTDPRVLKGKRIISTAPAPKADPSEEARARRKQLRIIEPTKIN